MKLSQNVRWGVFLLCLSGVMNASSAQAQTLQDALVSAYLTRPQLQADHARQRALDEDLARAYSGWRPQILLNGQKGYGRDNLNYEYLNPPQSLKETIHPEAYSLQLAQPLYDGGKTGADVEHAKSAIVGGAAHSEAVEQNSLAEAVQSYYDLYRDQGILDLSKMNVTALEDALTSVRARFEKKDATVADLSQAETRLAQGIAQRVAAEGAVAASESSFKQTTGLQPAKLAPPPPLPVALLPAARDDAIALALHNPTVREAEQAVKTSEADVKFAESALKPTLSLVLSSQNQKDVSQGHFGSQYNEVMLNLQVPLYTGGVDYARTREAKTLTGQRKFEADETRQQALDRMNRAWDQLNTVRGRIVHLTAQVKSAEQAWKAIQVEVKRGYREVIDELNAEQEYVNSEISFVQAQHDEAIAAYSVLIGAGKLTARALQLPVTYYDPEKFHQAESGRWIGTGIPANDELRRTSP